MRLVMLCLLVTITAPAWADWEKIYESAELTYFVDPDTVRKMGDLRLASAMRDLKAPTPTGEISRRAIVEYDCKADLQNLLSVSVHSGTGATGSTLFRENYPKKDWQFISPGTIAQLILKYVCAQ